MWKASYAPFGEATEDLDPDGDGTNIRMPIRFPGQWWDFATGLHYNYYRDYDPATGRYLEADPIGQGGALNLYAYTANNPVNYHDSDGLDRELPSGPNLMRMVLGNASPKKIQDRAFATGRRHATDGARIDALAHCIGACELGSRFGHSAAKSMLEYYEIYTATKLKDGIPVQQERDLLMDLHNNLVGQRLAVLACPGQCEDRCVAALDDGDLLHEGHFEGDHIGPWATWWRILRFNVGL